MSILTDNASSTTVGPSFIVVVPFFLLLALLLLLFIASVCVCVGVRVVDMCTGVKISSRKHNSAILLNIYNIITHCNMSLPSQVVHTHMSGDGTNHSGSKSKEEAASTAKQVVDALVEMLQKRFHLQPKAKDTRLRSISASFDKAQSQRFKQNMLCMLGMMLASHPDESPRDTNHNGSNGGCGENADVGEHSSMRRVSGMVKDVNSDKETSSILNDMLSNVAGALTQNHQPKYISPQAVHSHLSVHKTMSYREFGFRMSQLDGLSPEQKVMYTRNQDVINELDSEYGGDKQKSVHCYQIKNVDPDDDGNTTATAAANARSFETQYVVACSIDYIRKRFDLFSCSRVLSCDKYVYLIADSEDLLIFSKCIVPYIELIFPMHKINYGTNSFLAAPLVVDALATSPPRSRMVKYAMWMLAALMYRTKSTDPIDMLFKELVRDGDEILACQGRALIIQLLGFQAQQRHDSVAKHASSNSCNVYYECPTSHKARSDAIRNSGKDHHSHHYQGCVPDSTYASHQEYQHQHHDSQGEGKEDGKEEQEDGSGQNCTSQQPRQGKHCSKKRSFESSADVVEDEEVAPPPCFTEEDVANYKAEQVKECIAHCFVKDVCLMANRGERWCMPSNVVGRLMDSFDRVSDLPLSLAKLRNCIMDGYQDPRLNLVKDVVICRPTNGLCEISRPIPRPRNPATKKKSSIDKDANNGGGGGGDGGSCFQDTPDDDDDNTSTMTQSRKLPKVRKSNGRLANHENRERWKLGMPLSLHKSIVIKREKIAKKQPRQPNPILTPLGDGDNMDSPMSDSPGSVNATTGGGGGGGEVLVGQEEDAGPQHPMPPPLLQETNHISDSESESNGDDDDNDVGDDAMSLGSNITSGTNASAGNQSVASRKSMRSMRSGRTTTSMKSMEHNFVIIPPQLLPALLFDLANHPSLSHTGDRFMIKRRVTFMTGEKDAYNFLFTKEDDTARDDNGGGGGGTEACSGPPPPMPPPDFNGTVGSAATATATSQGTKNKVTREVEAIYKRLYTEPLYTEPGSENKASRSRRRTEAQMQWQLNCILAMHSAPPPKDVDAKSIQNCKLSPIHRRAARYEYKMVAMDKVNLSRVDRGWIALEAHLVMTEELIRNFAPLSHQIKGIHSIPRLHLTSRKANTTTKQARKKLKKGHSFTGGAYTHGLAVTLNVSSDASPSDVLPCISKPKFSSDAMTAMSSSQWGPLVLGSYLHGLGSTGGIMPWQIQSWMANKQQR